MKIILHFLLIMSSLIVNDLTDSAPLVTTDDWIDAVCEETYFVTLQGTWNDPKKKIWETPEGELYQVDRNNFVSDYVPPSNKRSKYDEDDEDGAHINDSEEESSNKKNKVI
jgi:hypothetical protein